MKEKSSHACVQYNILENRNMFRKINLNRTKFKSKEQYLGTTFRLIETRLWLEHIFMTNSIANKAKQVSTKNTIWYLGTIIFEQVYNRKEHIVTFKTNISSKGKKF